MASGQQGGIRHGSGRGRGPNGGAKAALPLALLSAGALAAFAAPAAAQALEEVVITGRRGGVPAYERPFGPTVIGPQALDTAPQRRLDEALRAVPGFSLFRRTGSRTANPTAQGVSLRGIGPNGAGRTLVLVDGVPVNDPFGGWTYWSRLPTAQAEQVVITRGGGAGPWGNAALAGTVRIETRLPDGLYGELSAGSNETYQALASAGGKAGPVGLGLTAGAFSTGGTPLVRSDRRGPIDIDADADAYWLDGVASVSLGDVTATAKLSGFKEHRGNGTLYTENGTEAVDASLRLVGGGAVPWELVAYARDWTFESTFSGVNPTRTAETPSLDQYEVPSNAYGAVAQVGVFVTDEHQTDVGADIRWTDGETRELFTFQNGNFVNNRVAGGEQQVAGVFVEHAWTPTSALAVTAGGRLDWWQNTAGRRTENNRATGLITRDTRFQERDGEVLNGRLGVDWQTTDQVGLRAAAYTGFRLPTLNELYRPFRVGNDITEANPDLAPERLTGAEAGVRFTPAKQVRASLTGFAVRLEQAVDNTVVQTTPGLNAELSVFVPAGGRLSQRRGLEEVEIRGIEAELGFDPLDSLSFTLAYLFNDSEITQADRSPQLLGNRLGQVPRHQGTAEATWRPVAAATLRLQVRAASEAFEDSDNSGTIAPYVVADLYAGYDVTSTLNVFATVENLTDRTIETGRRGDGLVSVGPGRQWLVGVKARL